MATTTEKPKPVQSIKIWPCEAAIWRNGEFYNVTLSRSYKDGETYKSTSSFGRDDLLLAAKLLDHCHTWILRQEAKDHEAKGDGR